jgi:cell cycle arrest protein BUB3
MAVRFVFSATMSLFADYNLPLPPNDPVSSLTFNPNPSKANELLVASWDKTVRFYRLVSSSQAASSSAEQLSSQVQLVHTFQHEAAVLDVCWISDTLAASGGLDRRVRLLNLVTGQSNIIGKHDAAISRVRYSSTTNLLLSSSWDASLKVWDPTSSSPTLLHTIALPDKVLAMDLSPPFPHTSLPDQSSVHIVDPTPRAVVGMAGRNIHIFDLAKWRQEVDRVKSGGQADEQQWKAEQKRESSLKFMVRDIRCMPSGDGYATSSVEGRIAVEFFDTSSESQAKKYAFKCHRQVIDGVDTVYPVNAMAFHPAHATFASLGGDAIISIWDPLAKKRIRQYPKMASPLSTGAISSDGAILATASGFENIEDTRHKGESPGEVGELGKGGEGNIAIHIRSAWEDCKPKTEGGA